MATRILRGERLERELAGPEVMTQYGKEYEAYTYTCGIDKTGGGPLAGPVTAGVMTLPEDCRILHLNDSKKPSEKRREELLKEIRKKTAVWSVGIMSPARTNETNILQTTYGAMGDVMGQLGVTPDVSLNDATVISGLPMKQVPIMKGDIKSLSVAAANVLIKVTRDHMMTEYKKMFSGYGFTKYRGYGTAARIQAIRELGPRPIHRRSFIRNFVEQEGE